eukprot:TRINITY_DN2255_c0_g1_i5.p1 TRINITY_DN2255_c0_g1~~TRINITY_DN2255_c0_g1_i5.p1  ORF type:complete len:207 (-),score=22.05 TRINITY_DN2255_c0_g1_i5:236-856(-)
MVADELEMEVVFGASHGTFGNGIISRYPIGKSQNHILVHKSDKEHPRSLLRAEILFPETSMTIFATHLEHISEKIRLLQIEEVCNIMRLEGPHALFGDLNTLCRRDYNEMEWQSVIDLRQERRWIEDGTAEPQIEVIPFLEKQGYRDIFDQVGTGKPWTAWTRRPIMRIDYGFTSSHFPHDLCRSWVCSDIKCSDHFPVRFDIQFR